MAAVAERAPRVLVVGCGGIGGVVAASLAELGIEVSCATGNEAVAVALRERGATLRDEKGERVIGGLRAHVEAPESDGPFDFVLLATQPPQVEDAARKIAPLLGENGRVVCFQNGLCEARVAAIVGPERVSGGVVGWGASQKGPGVYEKTATGGFALGYPDGHIDARLGELARLLECVGPVDVTTNLLGARWSKLAINCAISALGTIGGDRLGVLLRSRSTRRLALELMTETVLVARAEGVRLEKVSGTFDLDWIALTEVERLAPGSPGLVAKHGLLLAVGARFRRMRSSMLAAIERGRPPAVDFLNGEVCERAKKHGIPTPVNAAIRETIHRIGRHELAPSHDLLRSFYDETAAVRG
jgi:2-dehydropantoate 2-reductase